MTPITFDYPAVTQYEVDGQGVTTGRVLFTAQQVDVSGGLPVYANSATYAYYAYTGRLKSITRTVGSPPADVVQYFAYDDQARQTHVWGNGTYPVQYTYDDYGRRETMTTYRSPAGVDFTGASWPANAPTGGEHAEITTWVYDEATGLLKSKKDDANKAISYSYTPEGRMKTRTWARPVSTNRVLATEYLYSPATGELTNVNYWHDNPSTSEVETDVPDPDTHPLEFTYTRLGRQATVEDGVGTRTFTYGEGATGKLHLVSEAIAGTGGFYSRTITRDPQDGAEAGEVPGRDGGFHIGTEYGVAYYYDNAGTGAGLTGTGRFKQITGPGLPGYVSPSQPGYGVEYSRLADSDLVEYTRYKPDSGTIWAGTQRDYESNRDLIEWVENKVGATTISRYAYTNDGLGRRTAVTMSGSAFTGSGGDHHWDYRSGYNDRSELTGGLRKTGTTLDAGSLMTPGDYDYAYDHIGNRTSSNVDNDDPPKTYAANDVNQYTTTSDPDESFSYDDDGNLLQDGAFTYTWDAENRLKTATPRNPSLNDAKVEFTYDYMGRRVEKVVYYYSGSAWPEDPDLVQRFVYDGWNVVLVLNDENETLRTFTWGLDLSGTIHGAGGIGGLLSAVEVHDPESSSDDEKFWYFHDANGNVGQILTLESTNPLVIYRVAHYEYDPFGNTILIDDLYYDISGNPVGGACPFGHDNPFRFSTKWFDDETGLGYWGYRYYSPRLGRWISRDPIGEQGGVNLCQFVYNHPTDFTDILGLWTHDGVLEAYGDAYGEQSKARLLALMAFGHLKIGSASTYFDDWYVENNTIYIADAIWLGWARSDANAAAQLNEALAIYYEIGSTSWVYKLGRIGRGGLKVYGGFCNVAAGSALCATKLGAVAGVPMIGFGVSTFCEGVTQIPGYGQGENGFNPGGELARALGGDTAATAYYVADIVVSIGGGLKSLKGIPKARTFNTHIVARRVAGNQIKVTKWYLAADGSYCCAETVTETQYWKLQIVGNIMEAVSAADSVESSGRSAGK